MLSDQPSQKQWVVMMLAVFVGALIMLFVVTDLNGSVDDVEDAVGNLSDAQQEIRDAQDAARERGYINRAVSCMDIINDMEIQLTNECVDPNVAAYYPSGLCAKLSPIPEDCGSKV